MPQAACSELGVCDSGSRLRAPCSSKMSRDFTDWARSISLLGPLSAESRRFSYASDYE